LEHNWHSSLSLSFLPCDERVNSWFKRNLEKRSDLSYTEVKKIISNRYGSPPTDFQKVIRFLRIKPMSKEPFIDYMDRYIDSVESIPDDYMDRVKFIVFLTLFQGSLERLFMKRWALLPVLRVKR
jgi:hypothetical protein